MWGSNVAVTNPIPSAAEIILIAQIKTAGILRILQILYPWSSLPSIVVALSIFGIMRQDINPVTRRRPPTTKNGKGNPPNWKKIRYKFHSCHIHNHNYKILKLNWVLTYLVQECSYSRPDNKPKTNHSFQGCLVRGKT